MLRKYFKPDFQNELESYNTLNSYIANMKNLLDEWINNNKYKRNENLSDILDELLQIELDINCLKSKNDISKIKEISLLYEKLELCLKKLKNRILYLSTISNDDYDMLLINAEIINIRNCVAANISLKGVSEAIQKIGYVNFIKDDSELFSKLIILENEIYIRKNKISQTDMLYR
ncbi:MAG: hypothetical protein E7163_02810 [Firmicutes bacterium]|nr:hypothetical protein [Bacillota bacterium]